MGHEMQNICSIEMLLDFFIYDKGSGTLTNKRSRGRVKSGEQSGWVDGYGYLTVQINGKNYKAHRVVWAMVNGYWPKHYIDHINGIRTDNRISNLREATHSQNLCNCKHYSNNKSGMKGVSFHRGTGKWVAQITVNGTPKYLGLFEKKEDASLKYLEYAGSIGRDKWIRNIKSVGGIGGFVTSGEQAKEILDGA